MSRRDAAAAATREALLRSARSAFGRVGYAEASLAEIARDAGATTGALYHHFADKKQLFTAVAEDIEAELLAHLARSAPRSSDLLDVLTFAVSETLAYAAKPGIANVIFKEAPSIVGPAAWRAIEMRYGFGQMHAILAALSKAGQLGDHDPGIVAGIVLGSTIAAVDSVAGSAEPARALERAGAALLAVVEAFATSPPKRSRSVPGKAPRTPR